MARRISPSLWAKYKGIINEFHNDAFQDDITWVRNLGTVPRHGEDRPMNEDPIALKGLFQYNGFRVWPLTQFTPSGEEDKQSEVILFNIQYLKSLNLLDTENRLPYDQAKDIFIHRGIKYESGGDTLLAQAEGEPLLFLIILKKINGYSDTR